MLNNLDANINKLKDITFRYTIYEKVEEIQGLTNQLKIIIEKLEGSVENRKKIKTQV